MIAPFVQAGAGIAQAIFGGINGRRAQKELEKMQSPVYSPSKSILDYYNQAKSRYNISPYESNLFKLQSQNIQRGTAQGLQALSGRGAALAGVSSLIQGQNDAYLRAGAAAEQEQAQRLGQLGQAAQLKAGEDMKMFQYNKLAPFERRSSMLGAKAAAGAATFNSGLTNIFGGLQGLDNMKMKMLELASGKPGSSGGGSTGGGSSFYTPDFKSVPLQ